MQQTPLTLPLIFRRAERLYGDKLIITSGPRGKVRMKYAEWTERTRRLGSVLDALGVSADGRVATFAWNSNRHLELYYAAPCTGRVLHTLNIRLFADQLTYIVNHAEDEVIFVDRSLVPVLWPMVEGFETVRHYVVMDDTGGAGDPLPDDPRLVDYEELLAAAAPAEFVVEDENQAAAMCYTSGTTGNPKGVVYSHRSMVLHTFSTMLVDSLAITERDTILPIVPMFHANAWGFAQSAVMAGADIVFPTSDMTPAHVIDLLESEKVTFAAGVPTIWMGVLPLLEGRDLSSLNRILSGGSAVPKSLSEAYRQKIGVPLLQGWGMTETSPLASAVHITTDLDGASDDELADVRASQGIVVPGVDLRIVEPGTIDELPWDGEARGELQVSGPWIAREYYNDPRSGDSFTKDGWLRTGDVATVDEHGYIRLVDRTKDLIKSGGEWISSVELENEIMAHPKVAEAAVVGVAHEKWQERPLACVVAKEGESLSKQDVLDFLSSRVPKWWMPDDVVFIDEVPKTSVGKFSKKTLRDQFADYVLPT
jgi:fatty-acyl-CoA synthase